MAESEISWKSDRAVMDGIGTPAVRAVPYVYAFGGWTEGIDTVSDGTAMNDVQYDRS